MVQAAQLNWSASPDPTEFTIHYGSASGSYDQSITVAGTLREHLVEISPGTYFFVITATDAEGTSALSNEVSKSIPQP